MNAQPAPRNATFLCPACVTGGPEAIHQASMALRAAGLSSDIGYYRLHTLPERIGDKVVFDHIEDNPCLSAFAQYEPRAASDIAVRDDTLVVLPEVLVGKLDMFLPARIAVWWLSVDNALVSCPSLKNAETRTSFFERGGIDHWYQSEYARRFLISGGARSARRLTDFTHPAFALADPTCPNSAGTRVLYNRRKGAALAQQFFDANPQFEPVALDGLDRDALIATYRSAGLYVDFGYLPGKDRMPREAAACGCTIFLHQKGAGCEIGDFPIHDIFRFATEEIESGQLAAKLQFALANFAAVWQLQTVLRETIRQERHEFLHEAAVIAKAYEATPDSAIAARLAAA